MSGDPSVHINTGPPAPLGTHPSLRPLPHHFLYFLSPVLIEPSLEVSDGMISSGTLIPLGQTGKMHRTEHKFLGHIEV
ncbi:hypothetical protein K466DRAFT_605648 [Polyporus arcularius HHB13444]|uniref:Uncharacterized protein n=1 Tax=Polyporus arcularius HHB13444 TaxID=1314778 RepID=A0A5C3NRP7_9APHY|nr:hypothetical protein K466DRAFT_605648 [Polyporus arcularius HHB13444]